MAQSDVSDLFRALVHVGAVEGVRQEYQVFRTAGGDFVVISPSSRGTLSYHMTQVPAGKVEALSKVVGKEGVTTGSLMKDQRLEGVFDSEDKVAVRFDILMGLYVLSALGRIEMTRDGRKLVFKKAAGKA
ncbi:MAG: hypothetical protein KGI38_01295 [Thaumarchaeota archaeon]|nr:hypothetical protein [Nitrososphaerota archaeon]